jgi:chromosome segregation ATPase
MKLKGEFETKTKEQQDAYNRLKDELANTKASYEEFVRQQDEDHEDEMLQVQHHHKKALEDEQEAVLNLKSQASMMRRRFDSFKVEKEALQSELKEKEEELKVCHEKGDEQERQIAMLKNDIRDREQTIDNKEKRISELRMKAKELEKIKFVLDYKYKELKKEMEPKETQIVHMKEQIKEMDEELERDVRTNHALGQALNDKTHKIDNLNLEIKRQRTMVLEKERLVQLFVTDLEKLVTEIDPSYWRDAIRQLYRTYVKKGSKEAGSKDVPDAMDEFARQREYMERSLETLKKRAIKNEEAVKINNVKKAAENAILIDELNGLRREKRLLEVKLLNPTP